MTFYVGQKVVALRSGAGRGLSVTKGKVYVIRHIFDCPVSGYPLLNFVGERDVFTEINGYRCGWNAEKFRPLQETGMSILRAIAANPKRELEVVE